MNFINKNEFSLIIENIVAKSPVKIPYTDAILDYCTKNNMELEAAVKLLNKNLIKKIETEAAELNQIKSTYKKARI